MSNASPAASAPWSWLNWDWIALLARMAIAGVFWLSGQTKIEGLQINLVQGQFDLGWPHLADSAVALFRDEYKLPLLAPELAATLAAWGEHLLPILLLVGLGTRLAATGLLVMTATIQLLVYPGAWPTHGTWAALVLALMAQGPGRYSLDRLLAPRLTGLPRRLVA
jgi:putative oxidoreductase